MAANICAFVFITVFAAAGCQSRLYVPTSNVELGQMEAGACVSTTIALPQSTNEVTAELLPVGNHALVFNSVAACSTNSASNKISLSGHENTAKFYLRDYVEETVTLQLRSDSGLATSSEVTFAKIPYVTDVPAGSSILRASVSFDGAGSVYASLPASFVRLKANGIIDTNFTIPGTFNSSPTLSAEVPDGSGKVYLQGGFNQLGAQSIGQLIRFNRDGSLDSSFTQSTVTGSFINLGVAPNALDRVIVTGFMSAINGNPINSIARLLANGSLDPSFDLTGCGAISALDSARDGSGNIYVGGGFAACGAVTANNVARLLPTGLADPSFNTGTGFDNNVFYIKALEDGSNQIYARGPFLNFNSQSAPYVARLNASGTMDPTFAVGTGFSAMPGRIALAGDGSGKIYVPFLGAYNGVNVNGLVRLNHDGSYDSSFNIGTGFDAVANGALPLADGSNRILVFGSFTKFNGQTVRNIVRLYPDGTLD